MVADERLQALVESIIHAEIASDFSLLRRVPSTRTWTSIDVFLALPAERRVRLIEALSARGVDVLRPGRPRLGVAALESPAREEFDRFLNALASANTDGRYWDVRTLRSFLADARSPHPELYVPEETIRRAEAIRPTKATEIRKVVKEVVGRRFAARAEKGGGADWRYHGTCEGVPFILWIDCGGRSDQLRYAVSVTDEAAGIPLMRVSYENLLGFGLGGWDFVTQDNLQESVELLCELVRRVVAIPSAIAST